MNIAALFLIRTEEELIKYFKDRGAISTQTAIVINIPNLRSTLETPEFLEENLSNYNFIKKTSQGKYYLDQSVNVSNAKSLRIFLFFLLCLLFIPILFYFLKLLVSSN